MSEKPILNRDIDGITFRSYYYLKEELLAFCRQEGLQTIGGKIDLTNRISYYLDTGQKITSPIKNILKIKNNGIMTEESLIESYFVCSEKHRCFFKLAIGKTFSFNVAFQKWLKTNSGKTYKEAVAMYYQIINENKKGTTVIDKQFEYNAYIRLFFIDNSGETLENAIICWKYKKSLKGHNRYENSDLVALTCVSEKKNAIE